MQQPTQSSPSTDPSTNLPELPKGFKWLVKCEEHPYYTTPENVEATLTIAESKWWGLRYVRSYSYTYNAKCETDEELRSLIAITAVMCKAAWKREVEKEKEDAVRKEKLNKFNGLYPPKKL